MPAAADQESGIRARTLTSVADCARSWPVTRKADLEVGDRVLVTTKNSVYCLDALGGDLFHVSGGWFERASAPRLVTVNGCTFGGTVICTDIVAAPGLFLEFGNQVSTTRIRSVRVVRAQSADSALSN